ncbi:MAG: YceD family protein [Chloroflexota bacterium]
MKLNVAQLMKSAVGSTREYDLEEAFGDVEGQFLIGPVAAHLCLTRINDGILVRGDARAMLETLCSRCVEPTGQPISFHFEEQFLPTIDIVTGHVVEGDEPDEPVFTIDANHIMDLDELLRQGIVMETPMHPLCGSTCRGLCPRCGTNLNLGGCDCAPEAPSGPMAAILKDLVPLVAREYQ